MKLKIAIESSYIKKVNYKFVNMPLKLKIMNHMCDGIQRQSIKHLISVEKDPIRIIQYKEIYERP